MPTNMPPMLTSKSQKSPNILYQLHMLDDLYMTHHKTNNSATVAIQ